MDLAAVVDVLLAALAGLFVGSFVTMVVDRVPDGLPLFRRPRCPHCEVDLGLRELVPVVSWLWLRGKCRHCEHPITPAYPAVEIVTAALFVGAVLRFDWSWVVVPFLLLFAMLVAVSVVDLYDYRIPDRIVFPTLAVSVPLVLVVSLTDHDPNGVIRAVIGAVLFAGILFLTSLMPGGGMGFGDVKLALVLGFFLGYVGSNLRGLVLLVFTALLIGSLLGVVMGLAVGALRTRFGRDVLPDPEAAEGELAARAWSKQPIPFGPSLALATVVAVLFSNELLAH
jgi:leader peptidase (prepilin peptidase)/N-methyltransferase